MLSVDGEFPLFEDGEPSSVVRSVIEFCAALRHLGDATDEFVRALREHDLLMPNDATIDLKEGKKLQLLRLSGHQSRKV